MMLKLLVIELLNLLVLHLLKLLLLRKLLILLLKLLVLHMMKLLLSLSLWRTLLTVVWALMLVHLGLEHPGSDGTVLAVQIGLPNLADWLLGAEAQNLVRGHFHVGLALLCHLPLLVHHLLEVVQEGSGQAACVPGLLPPGQLLGVAVPDGGCRNVLRDGRFNCFYHLDIVIKGYFTTRGFGQRVGFLKSWGLSPMTGRRNCRRKPVQLFWEGLGQSLR